MTPAGRRALIVTIAGAALVAFYVFSFVLAQATPEPHELPVAVAGPAGKAANAERRIERAAGESFDVRRLRGVGEARAAIRDREVYAALILGGAKPRLLTAPAGGPAAAMVVGLRLPPAAGVTRQPALEQIRPLVGEDPDGQALNLMILPLLIFGIVVPILLTTLAPGLPVRSRLAALALFAALAGCGATAVVNVGLSALPGPFLALAGFATLMVFAVSSVTMAAIALLGPAGALVGIVGFLIVGNVASGAAVPNELLPGFWRTVGPWLPPGAGASALRGTAYFDAAAVRQPTLVLGGFALVGAAVDLVLGDRRPAAQGDPSGGGPDQEAVEA
jgi:hypothetical protein